MSKPRMQAFVNADSVLYRCPCGDSIEGEGEPIRRFIAEHKTHTNGWCQETITPDGARFCTPPKRPRCFRL